MYLHFQKLMKYLQFANPTSTHWYNYDSCFALHSFANKSDYCDWFLTITKHQAQTVRELYQKAPKISFQVERVTLMHVIVSISRIVFLSMCISVQLLVLNFVYSFLTISHLDHSAAAQSQLQKHFGTMLASTSTSLSFSLHDVLLSS